MAKHPMGDALDKAEAYVKERRRAQRLADAAPDLLAALRHLLAEGGGANASPAIAHARAAIRKATGEAG